MTERLVIYNVTQSSDDRLGSIHPGSSLESENMVPTSSSIAGSGEFRPEIADALSVLSDFLIGPGRPQGLLHSYKIGSTGP